MVLLGLQNPVALKDQIEKKLSKERGKLQHLMFSLFHCYVTMLQCFFLCSLSPFMVWFIIPLILALHGIYIYV